MKRLGLAAFAAMLGALCASHPSFAQSPAAQPSVADAPPAQFAAGKDYQRITPPQPTSTEDGRVEVAEIFMFGCPGCYAFEPRLQAWLETKPDYVRFVRIPAPWNAVAELHARAYYAAEELGKAGEIDAAFFNEFHAAGNHLDDEDALAAFFARFGVDESRFRSTFNSPAIDAKLARAADLVKRYRVPSTPSVVVAGKYLTSGSLAGTYPRWFAIIEALAALEHDGEPAAAN